MPILGHLERRITREGIHEHRPYTRVRHTIFSESNESRIVAEHRSTVARYRRFGGTEGGSGGGGLDMGDGSWRRRSRQGIAALFRRRRVVGDAVADRACR